MDKATLHQFSKNMKELKQLEGEIKELRRKSAAAPTQRLTGMPGSGSNVSDPTGNAAAAIADLCALYDTKVQKLCEQQRKIEEAIDSLSPSQRVILRARYIDGYEWEEVCYRCSYSWSHAHRLHAEALRKLESVE